MWRQSQEELRILLADCDEFNFSADTEVTGFVSCGSLQSHLFAVDERAYRWLW